MQGQTTAPALSKTGSRITLQASDTLAKRRRAVNALMTTLISGSAVFGVSILGIILGYICLLYTSPSPRDS